MKLTIVVITAFLMQVSASTSAQFITLKKQNIPLKMVFAEIRKQTGYTVLYGSNVISNKKPIDVNLNNVPLKDALTQILQGQDLTYSIEDKSVVVSKREPSFLENIIARFQAIDVRGRVVDENGSPLVGATVTVVGGKNTKTDQNGEFYLPNIDEKATLKISYVGYKEIEIKAGKELNVQMQLVSSDLQEVVVNKGYYTEKRELSTGSVGHLKASEIEKQTVINPIGILEGHIAGVSVIQNSGLPGTNFKVRVRGQNSLLSGSEPLYIIDGVPLAAQNQNLNVLGSIASPYGISPLNNINPSDIESVDVLKDADATSIYGSRGANGVVLITTKRGRSGSLKFNSTVSTGFSDVAKFQKLLNTEQYLKFRREAFANDDLVPNSDPGTPSYAPDLTVWNQNRNTDWQKLLIGNTAHNANATASLSGGNEETQFLLSTGFYRETSVFPTDASYKKGNAAISLDHKALDNKFIMHFGARYSTDMNKLFQTGLEGILLSPNAPELYDASGKLNWSEGGVGFANPLAGFLKNYEITTNDFQANLDLNYKLTENLSIKSNFGFNKTNSSENSQTPIDAQNPLTGDLVGTSSLGKRDFRSFIVEPILEYNTKFLLGKVTALVGGSYQSQINDNLEISGTGYTNDALIKSLYSAPSITTVDNTFNEYKYAALFGKITYNYADRYVLNFTARRDGSSRFGPAKKFNNFGAIGAAWVFSNESFLKNNLSWLTYGKFRGSLGITGNDQIGDYKYIDSWQSPILGPTYQNTTALSPSALFNPNFSWERNKKSEIGMEAGFFNNRLNATINYFINQSNNQLVQYSLPSTTGFTGIISNLNAKIQNKGFEFDVTGNIIQNNDFKWNLEVNITLPKNKLVAFPNLITSTYASAYVIGQSVNVIFRPRSLGVNPETGVYTFEDVNGDGEINNLDYIVSGNSDPKSYGGFTNTFSYKAFQLSIFSEFKIQKVRGFKDYKAFFGDMSNLPFFAADNWKSSGNIIEYQKSTATTSSAAFNAAALEGISNNAFTNGNYLRLKAVSLSFAFPKLLMSKLKISNAKIYLQGLNLLTVTKYKGGDPETGAITNLPILKTINMGIQITL